MSVAERHVVASIFGEYEAEMRSRNALDFDDMLVLAVRLLRESEPVRRRYGRLWSHLHVDEFQVTTVAESRKHCC